MYYKFSYYQNFTTFFCSKRPIFNISQAFVKKMPTTLPFNFRMYNKEGNLREILKNDVSNIGNRAFFLERMPNLKELPHRFTAFCNNFARCRFRKSLIMKELAICENEKAKLAVSRPPTALCPCWKLPFRF